MKRVLCTLLSIVILSSNILAVSSEVRSVAAVPEIKSKSAVLMDSAGNVLLEHNGHEKLQPASVTKVMTMLLIMEAIDSGRLKFTDMVTASDHARKMGGTQIFLEQGEQMTVEDMLKSIVVSSANDAAVAMAEHISGSEEAFVDLMNSRAKELGMHDTQFVNANGLDGEHETTLTTAYDIGLASSELLKHEKIKDFTTIWMDTVRNGQFGLANTNKMLKSYKGMTGLKTGYIRKAGFCISATAKRDDMELIAIIMAAPTKEERMADATALLNYGFANYTTVSPTDNVNIPSVNINLGKEPSVNGQLQDAQSIVIAKNEAQGLSYDVSMQENLRAPVYLGQTIGTLTVKSPDKELMQIPIVADRDVEELGIIGIFMSMLSQILMK